MGWTPLTTRATNFFVTAAVWDAEVVDNLNTGVMHLIARKTSDQTNSTTTYANDTALILPVLANEVWQCQMFVSEISGDNWKMGFTWPSGGIMKGQIVISGGATSFEGSTTQTDTRKTVATWGSGQGQLFTLNFLYTNGGTGGNVTLEWACNTAVSCIVKTNSSLWGVKLA